MKTKETLQSIILLAVFMIVLCLILNSTIDNVSSSSIDSLFNKWRRIF